MANGFVRLTKTGGGGGGTTSLEVGTTSITNGTVGRVLFQGTGNVLQQSSSLFWNNTNKHLGIGTETPLGVLHLKETAQTTRFLIDGDAGQSKIITFRTSGLQRFGVYCNNIAESGANAGSNLAIRRYDDAGTLLGTPFYIFRNSGNVLINSTTDSGFKFDVVGGDARFNSVRVGRGAGDSVTNTIIGDAALFSNTTGTENTAFSRFAMFSNTTGNQNTAVGLRSLQDNTTGSSNISLGYQAGRYIADATTPNTITSNSVFLGALTRANANSQTNQIVIGYNVTGLGSNSVVLGNSSITLTALRGNVLIGTTTDAGYKLDVVGNDARINTLTIGLGGGQVSTNIALGLNALGDNTTGYDNTAIGTQALGDNTIGEASTAVGYYALQKNTTGNNNSAFGYASLLNNLTASNHTASGTSSLRNLTSGSYNTAFGVNAGRYIADGATNLTTSSTSIFIGSLTKPLANSQTNQIVIGYDAIGLGSNSVVLGNSSITLTALRGNVLIGTTTDAGYRLDVNGTARVSGTTTITPATLTGATATSALDISQTWNTTGTPIALKVNITDTASNALSDLISLQVGGSTRFRVLKSGFFTFATGGEIAGNLLVGGTSINTSSQLEVRSTTKGFLPPRMTTAEKNAIATPASGLVVYDTTLGKLCVRGASAWETITSV